MSFRLLPSACCLLLLACCAGPAAAQSLNPGNAFYTAGLLKPAAAAGGGDSCSSCTNETFEGTGYVVAGWVEGGTANEDYTTSPAPLDGSQSLSVQNSGFDTSFTYLVMPSSSEGWARWRMRVPSGFPDGLTIFSFSDNLSALNVRVSKNTGLQITSTGGGSAGPTSDEILADTTYYCWAHFKAGTGNGEMTIAFSTSKTRPTSGGKYAKTTTATVVNTVQYTLLAADLGFNDVAANVIFDHVSFSTGATPIGDFP